LLSCNRSQSKIDDVKDEIEYAEKNKADLTANDLKNLEIIMDELEGDISLSPDKYTEEQIKEVRTLQGKYAALLVKKGINDFQVLASDKILASEIKWLRNEYLEISPYLPT
jgi:hypothetical protein